MTKEEKRLKIKDKIYAYLKEGMCKKDAALLAGISEKTFYRWVAENDSFDSRVEANIIKYKASLVEILSHHAEKDWRPAFKILQQRWPDEWGENGKIETERKNESSSKDIADLLLKIYRDQPDRENLPEVS